MDISGAEKLISNVTFASDDGDGDDASALNA